MLSLWQLSNSQTSCRELDDALLMETTGVTMGWLVVFNAAFFAFFPVAIDVPTPVELHGDIAKGGEG